MDVSFASVRSEYGKEVAGRPYYLVPDFHRKKLWALPHAMVATTRLVLKLRPDVVISTGAAPGLLALAAAKWLTGARTIWIDSLANADQLSGSGEWARLVADVWLTQWGIWPVTAARNSGGPWYDPCHDRRAAAVRSAHCRDG
jgi:hypothetical protein